MNALPSWLTPLLGAETMREIDRWAVAERGVAGLELMERAGAEVARALERVAPEGPVTVVCGKGNNGGDGLVAARLLRDAGRAVRVLSTAPPEDFAGDARTNVERLRGEPPLRVDGSAWSAPAELPGREVPGAEIPGAVALSAGERAGAIVDALLGTGFHGEPHGEAAAAIAAINAAHVPVISVDVPSGVDASTGVVAAQAVRATCTVSLHADKPGLWIAPGKTHTGELSTVDIGIPRGAPQDTAIGLIDAGVTELIPRRGAASTKFSSGHVLVAGGSRGLTGAPMMAARAAMRTGAGYVSACVPASLQAILAAGGTPELMTVGLAEHDGALSEDAVEGALHACERGGALILGPGMGRAPGAVAFARALARRAQVALLLDADGLNAHAGRLEELAERTAATVLTPHAGELARLLECDSAEIERERLAKVREAAARSRAVVVLKGDDTLVAAPDGRVAVSRGGSPALATAGTGDVLGGVIAALLAQGLDAFAAAAGGVWLHARAGRLAAERLRTAEAVVASDVIAALAGARASATADRGAGAATTTSASAADGNG